MLTDLRHALRLLWKSKRITATTLVTLALCIGATTAIFSSVYSLMLKPLPYQEPERIVELYTSAVKAGLNHMPANIPFYLDYSKNASSYESLGLWTFFYSLVGDKQSVVRTPGVRMTAEMFDILRVRPILGSFFTKDQNKQGADKVIVLTQSYWRTEYQERPEVIGQEIRIDDEAYKVIGVAPRELEAFDARMKFVVPLSWPQQAENPQGRYGVGLQLFGRLKPGVSAGQADAEAKVMEKRYVDAGPPPLKSFVERSGMTMNVGGVQEQRVEPVRPTLLMLQGGVAFVLLIGCVNVANLLLVRSNARQSEMAIRTALGAGRATIARQFLMESMLLTSIGAVLGLGVAWAALRATNFYLAKMLPQSLPAALDWRVLGFAVALALVIGLLIGLMPVIHTLRMNLAAMIQSSSRGASSSRGVRALSSALVVAQVAVALMLLTGAGLLIQSFANALKVDTGLEAENVVTARIALTRRTSRQCRRGQLDSHTAVRGDAEHSGRDVGGAVLLHTFSGGTSDQRLHAGERHPAAGIAAAGRVPRLCDAGLRRNARAEGRGRPLLRRSGPDVQAAGVRGRSELRAEILPEGIGDWRPVHLRPPAGESAGLAHDHRRRERRAAQRRRGEERKSVHLSTLSGRAARRIDDVRADDPAGDRDSGGPPRQGARRRSRESAVRGRRPRRGRRDRPSTTAVP